MCVGNKYIVRRCVIHIIHTNILHIIHTTHPSIPKLHKYETRTILIFFKLLAVLLLTASPQIPQQYFIQHIFCLKQPVSRGGSGGAASAIHSNKIKYLHNVSCFLPAIAANKQNALRSLSSVSACATSQLNAAQHRRRRPQSKRNPISRG